MTKNNNDLTNKLVFASLLGITGGLSFIWFIRTAIKNASNSFLKRLMIDPYNENLWELVSASRRVGLQNIIETNLRAQSGKVLKRPLGSPKNFPDLSGIMFNYAQLHKPATNEKASIDTSVIIGPQAKKPLKLKMPILIAGMAYGLALSAKAKIALAKGSSIVGTATNTGEGPFLSAERKFAKKLIIQYSKNKWSKSTKVLKQADMIEILFGQGAGGGVGKRSMELSPREKAIIHANFPGLDNSNNLKSIVTYLRKITGGVPIGVKLAASKYTEEDLRIAVESGVDVISIDGSEAATKGTAPILQDDFGLPTLFALHRATNFMKKNNLKDKVSLIILGGFFTPGDFLKAIALGADAVGIGSIALYAMSHSQVLKTMPWEPPPEIVFYKGQVQNKLNVKKASKNLANFLIACNEEIKITYFIFFINCCSKSIFCHFFL
jgi:glutamate synthase domain-containing protein 2